jgi:hypothetical protein
MIKLKTKPTMMMPHGDHAAREPPLQRFSVGPEDKVKNSIEISGDLGYLF